MAKMLPPYIDRSCKSTAEKMIFETLKKSSFTKDWVVLHSLNLSQHTVRLYGEIDFLILIPNGGIYVMEVKGGDVKCKDGVWYFTDRYGNVNRNKSPFNQARDAMFSLLAAVEKEFGKGHKLTRVLSGFFCAFPQMSFDKHSVEYESWQILDETSIQNGIEVFFQNLTNRFIDKHKGQKWFSERESLPDVNDLNILCDFFRGDFERVRTAKERLSEFDRAVKKYTEEQYRVLDSFTNHNERCLIQGSAGTGKTMIAIESAIREAAQGKTVFLTCYNRLIGEWMQKQTEDWRDKITVSSLHSFLFKQLEGFEYDTSQNNKQDFYNKYLPLLLKELYLKGINKKFDKLIIDEGQDLIRSEYLSLFDSMLNGGLQNGRWEIYGDFERQAIYAQVSRDRMIDLLKDSGQHSNYLLKVNCRNTKQIGEETSLISGFDTPPFLLEYLEGIPVEYIFYNDRVNQRQILIEQLEKFSNNNIPINELVIISPKKIESSCIESIPGYTIKEIKNCNEPSSLITYYNFATIQSYKGMECNYVVITDVEHLSTEIAKSLLYVGMSRAKYGLVLLIAESMRGEYREILRKKLN